MKTAVFAGSFCPITTGHLDIIKRVAALCDTLVVGVTQNVNKTVLISTDKKANMIKKAVCACGLKNVQVKPFDGLLADFCKKESADFIIKSVRNTADFFYEKDMAIINRKNFGLETFLMFAAPEYEYISSSAVRELLSYGASIDGFVPECVKDEITEALK